ncbi:MAG: choice-of-anchor D domain-containing protein, partial [Mycobacterium sp.]|nr:choice-of-anchor D domain-containing protein [Mycobacterium sp.]
DVGAGAAKWCLSIIDNLPSVTASAGHSGTFVQGATSQPITLDITNNGTGSTGDPGGSNPLTVVDTLPTGLNLASSSGTGWSCSGTTTVTCTNDSAVAQSAGYPELTLDVNVADSATPGNVNNSFSVSGGGANSTTSNTDVINIEPAAVLAIQVTHTWTFTQGSTAEWDITVSNTTSGGSTIGTTTVSDTLPSGYTLNASSGLGWTCGGVGTVTCTSTSYVSGGSSFQTIQLTVNVPTTSPISVTNTASAFGGGDLTHTNLGTAVSGSDTVTVVQVPLVTLSATSLSYGSVDVGSTSSSHSVTMTNTGSATLTISSIALTGANASQFVFANNCGTSLAVGASCTIHGHFAPTATGAASAAVTITDNAADS